MRRGPSRIWRSTVAPAVAAVLCAASCDRAGESVQLMVTNADVLDVRTGDVLERRTIVVDGGKIVELLRSTAERPRAARVVETNGKLVIPGLVDAHSHLGMLLGDSLSTGGGLITRLSADPDSVVAYRSRYGSQYLPYGVTTVRDVGSSESDLSLMLQWREEPGPDLPDVYPSGGALVTAEEGRIPFPGHQVVSDPEDAVQTVRGYHAMGLHHIKLYWRLEEPEFRAALKEAQRLGMNVTGHIDFQVLDIHRALDLGLRSFEHAYTLGVTALGSEGFVSAWRQHLPRSIGDRQQGRFYLGVMEYFNVLGPGDPEMERLIARLAETGSTVVPTLHLFAQRLGLAPFDSPRLGSFDDLAGLTPDQLEHARKGYEILATYVKQMHEAGVRLAVGTDWIEPGKATLSEIWLLHQTGISMADALQIGTIGGADALGIADRVGAIEPGMKAHLVILDGDPFVDPDAILGPRTVIKDGVVVEERGARVACCP